jgi:hypothetical protein
MNGAQSRAKEGVDLLNQCDMRGAHQKFVEAYGMDSSDPSIALAFALTDVVFIAEDPALEELRPRFGFTAPFDTTWLWSKGGLLDRALMGGMCQSLIDFAKQHIAHPSIQDNGPDVLSTIDETLTFGDLQNALVMLAPRFEKLSQAFSLAAKNAGDDGVELAGGCGVQKQRLQRPELYALAAAFSVTNASVTITRAYDGAIPFRLAIDPTNRTKQWADMMNAHWLHVVDASKLSDGRTALRRSLDLAITAIGAAQKVKTTPPNAVIDWTQFPSTVLSDALTIAQAAHDALDQKDMALPFVSPMMTVDGPSFFDQPIELAPVAPPIFNGDTGSIQYDWTVAKQRIGPRLSPDPFTSSASFSWTVTDRWTATNRDQWAHTFDPSGHFTMTYSCR